MTSSPTSRSVIASFGYSMDMNHEGIYLFLMTAFVSGRSDSRSPPPARFPGEAVDVRSVTAIPLD